MLNFLLPHPASRQKYRGYWVPRKGEKGYLGPIGDDIPSLIPIIVGLITFFSAFTFALNEYNTRSHSFAADRDTLIIANTLKGDSYLVNYSEFAAACNSLRVRGLNYVAMVVDSGELDAINKDAQAAQAAGQPSLPKLSYLLTHLFSLDGSPLLCKSIPDPFTQSDLGQILSNETFVALTFPIALGATYAVAPGTLVVITWKV